MGKESKYKLIIGIPACLVALTALIAWLTGAGNLQELLKFFQPKIAYTVGDTIHFGEWDWRVLAVENGKALLITKNIIEQRPYNDEEANVTWETCTLRAYLNGEFLKKFSTQERAKICKIENVNFDNPWYETSGGSNTTDKVFLLSIEEVKKYFGDIQPNEERAARIRNDRAFWWLRSPGQHQDYAAYVSLDGKVPILGLVVSSIGEGTNGVRPALWLKIN